MSNSKLLIPEKINVGFQERKDTYTGKLAYVIYWDSKGVLRKEKSWNSWRDNSFPNLELENKPTEGFVLNKGVGGTKDSWSWNVRNEYIRVYDPRDFEFEISVANLLFILRECDCSKGKGLEGKFVYSWDGTELVLLPVTSLEYKNSVEFTALQGNQVSARDLKLGATYITKNQDKLVYLGKYRYFKYTYGKIGYVYEKRFIFCDLTNTELHPKNGYSLIGLKDVKSLSAEIDSECASDYSNMLEEYQNSLRFQNVKRLYLVDIEPEAQKSYYNYFWIEEDGRFFQIRSFNTRNGVSAEYYSGFEVKNGLVNRVEPKTNQKIHTYYFGNSIHGDYDGPIKHNKLYYETESGKTGEFKMERLY